MILDPRAVCSDSASYLAERVWWHAYDMPPEHRLITRQMATAAYYGDVLAQSALADYLQDLGGDWEVLGRRMAEILAGLPQRQLT